MTFRKAMSAALVTGALSALQSCDGIFSDMYDRPDAVQGNTVSGQLYIDASDWTEWHYIDLYALADSVSANPDFNTSSLWLTESIPMNPISAHDDRSGIYTYWYDVYGAGISVNEFREYKSAGCQPEPGKWTFAVHRNNVRTNGCAVAATDFSSIDQVPRNADYLKSLDYTTDVWNETDVWAVQDKMLLGLIGNQGIGINNVLSSWLTIEIPPMPPAFSIDKRVFVMKLPDGTYGAVQLENYQSQAGVKCCLTINYCYPL